MCRVLRSRHRLFTAPQRLAPTEEHVDNLWLAGERGPETTSFLPEISSLSSLPRCSPQGPLPSCLALGPPITAPRPALLQRRHSSSRSFFPRSVLLPARKVTAAHSCDNVGMRGHGWVRRGCSRSLVIPCPLPESRNLRHQRGWRKRLLLRDARMVWTWRTPFPVANLHVPGRKHVYLLCSGAPGSACHSTLEPPLLEKLVIFPWCLVN